jgi:hypothetical protein
MLKYRSKTPSCNIGQDHQLSNQLGAYVIFNCDMASLERAAAYMIPDSSARVF